jgi:serine/threonine protein kinase
VLERTRIGRFDIIERLGQGGMGVLYRATDPVLNREVAIKVLPADFLADEKTRARFYREARSAASLQHPNIVTIFDFGDELGIPYLVMEFLKGRDLAERMTSPPPLTLNEKLHISSQLCAGLAAVHERGIVHRDIKPANIWIESNGHVKLLDFGIAKLTSTTLTRAADFIGSTPYMSPEQLSGKQIDHRADIFSVGVVLYELLGGRKPFEGESPTAVMLKIVSEDPMPLGKLVNDLPPRLIEIVNRALKRDPAERFQSATEFSKELLLVRNVSSSLETSRQQNLSSRLYIEPADSLNRMLASADRPDELPSRYSRPFRLAVGATMVGAISIATILLWNGPIFGIREKADAAEVVAVQTTDDPADVAMRIAQPARLIVRSLPEGARIAVGQSDSGLVTPAELTITRGSAHAITLRKPGFETFTASITNTIVDAGVLNASMRALPIKFIARGAYPFLITEDDQVLSASARVHELSLVPPKALRFRAPELFLDQTITIEPTENLTVVRDAPSLGRLRVFTSTSLNGCQIFLRGRDLGFPPIVELRLAAGTHSIELKCPDGRVRREQAQVRAGQLTTVPIR